jgi:hypothetical protein
MIEGRRWPSLNPVETTVVASDVTIGGLKHGVCVGVRDRCPGSGWRIRRTGVLQLWPWYIPWLLAYWEEGEEIWWYEKPHLAFVHEVEHSGFIRRVGRGVEKMAGKTQTTACMYLGDCWTTASNRPCTKLMEAVAGAGKRLKSGCPLGWLICMLGTV